MHILSIVACSAKGDTDKDSTISSLRCVVVRNFISVNGTKAVNLMEIWEDLIQTEVSILAPHLKSVTELVLVITNKTNVEDAIRIKALSLANRAT